MSKHVILEIHSKGENGLATMKDLHQELLYSEDFKMNKDFIVDMDYDGNTIIDYSTKYDFDDEGLAEIITKISTYGKARLEVLATNRSRTSIDLLLEELKD